jgi:hypothetical protein
VSPMLVVALVGVMKMRSQLPDCKLPSSASSHDVGGWARTPT